MSVITLPAAYDLLFNFCRALLEGRLLQRAALPLQGLLVLVQLLAALGGDSSAAPGASTSCVLQRSAAQLAQV